jgi:sarcosine oxidase
LRDDEVGYFEASAGLLHPERCIETQLALARARGAVVRAGETVRTIKQDGGGVTVATDRGTYQAARAIVTAGPWLPEMVPHAIGGAMKVFRQALHWFEASSPAAYAPDRFPVFIWIHGDRDHDYFYGFPSVDGCGLKVATEFYVAPTTPDAVNRDVAPSESAAMFNDHLSGRLVGVTPRTLRTATCLYTVTPDSGFIIDTLPDRDRVHFVSACSGHGFKHSAAVGEMLAREVTGEGDGFSLEPFRMTRFAATA